MGEIDIGICLVVAQAKRRWRLHVLRRNVLSGRSFRSDFRFKYLLFLLYNIVALGVSESVCVRFL